MSTGKEVTAKMYQAMLKFPGSERPVKLDIKMSSKMIISVAMAVEYAMSSNEPGNLIRKIMSEDDQAKLMEFSREILKKGEVEEFYLDLKEMGQG